MDLMSQAESVTSSERYRQDPSLKTIGCSACRSLFIAKWDGVTRYSNLFEGRKNGCGVCTLLLEAIQHFKVANEISTSLDSISLVDWNVRQVQHEAYEERKNIDIYAPLGKIGFRLHLSFSSPSLDFTILEVLTYFALRKEVVHDDTGIDSLTPHTNACILF